MKNIFIYYLTILTPLAVLIWLNKTNSINSTYFFGLLFLGDSGAYLISFVIGCILIHFSYDNNHIVSPYFIACMLWYPAYENLFSIIRKHNLNKSPINPDAKHFHQLLFFYLKKG